MKIIRTISSLVIVSLSLCLGFTSCADDVIDQFDETVWVGTYPVETVSSTGEVQKMTGTISLEFHYDANECYVDYGIEGLLATRRTFFKTEWISDNAFKLSSDSDSYSNQTYSGAIYQDQMVLDSFINDSKVSTYELTKAKK